MIRIQEIIHKFEVGEGTWAIRAFVGLLLIVTLGVWYDMTEYRNFHAPEAMEAAALARNIARGEGFRTQCIRPLSIYLVGEQGLKEKKDTRLSRMPHPDIATPPVYPLLLAGLMKVLPFNYQIGPRFWQYQPELIIAVFNQLLFLLTIWLTYRIGSRLFDREVGAVAALLLAGAEIMWRFSVSGLSTNLVMLEFTALMGLLVMLERAAREEQKTTGWYVRVAVLTGILIGFGTLTRYSFGWLLLPVIGFSLLWIRPRGVLVAALILVAAAVVVTPWLARNYKLSGTLFGIPGYAIKMDTQAFPETRLERSLKPDLAGAGFRDYFRKFCGNTSQILQDDLPRLGGGNWAAAFFLAGVLLPFRNKWLGRLRLFLVGSLALMVVVQALGRTHLSTDSPAVNTENLLVILTPGVFIFGAAFFFVILEQMNLILIELRYLVVTLFVLLCSAPLIFTFLPPRTYPIVYPPYLPPWIQETSSMLKTNELMMSDMPWAVAWYGDRECVWTPLDTSRSFYAIYDEQKPVAGLYLTPLTTDARFLTEILQGPDREWSRFAVEVLFRTNVPPRFPLQHARKRYTPDQLFLSDRPRWQR